MFERILIPLDGSPRAELILEQVGRILKNEDSEILLLRAVRLVPGSEWAEEAGGYLANNEEAAQAYIDARVAALADRGVRARGRVVVDSAPEAILGVAAEERSTMIAMTTHGRTGMSRWFMGSVAEKVVRGSNVPALLVRSFGSGAQGALKPAAGTEAAFPRILVPTDGSPAAMAVTAPARHFARLFNSEVVVLHVQSPYFPREAILPGMEAGAPPPPFEPTPSEEDRTTASAAERFRKAGLRVKRLTVLGDPAAGILDQAAALGVDLIALATHGRSGLSRWVTGSVAERVLRHSVVPLLIVRATGARAARSRPAVARKRRHAAPAR